MRFSGTERGVHTTKRPQHSLRYDTIPTYNVPLSKVFQVFWTFLPFHNVARTIKYIASDSQPLQLNAVYEMSLFSFVSEQVTFRTNYPFLLSWFCRINWLYRDEGDRSQRRARVTDGVWMAVHGVAQHGVAHDGGSRGDCDCSR